MSFKIESNGVLGGLSGISGRLNISSQRKSAPSDAATSTASSLASVQAQTEILSVSNVKSAMSIAQSALHEIKTLKEKQLANLQEAEALSEVDPHIQELSQQNGQISDEINRIISEATFNGANVLSGSGNYSLDVESLGIHSSISTGNPSLVAEPLHTRFSTTTEAAAQAETLASNVGALTRFVSGFDAAVNKVDQVLDQTAEQGLIERAKAKETPTSIEDAEALAQQIAQDLGALSDPDGTQELIDATLGDLDTDTASILLDPD